METITRGGICQGGSFIQYMFCFKIYLTGEFVISILVFYYVKSVGT